MTTAHEILQAAQKHMDDRASTYDKPEGERSMSATVEAFGAITGVTLTEEQGWLFMALLKAVRSQQGDYHEDCYTDGAAYFALAGEAAYGVNGVWTPWYGADWCPVDSDCLVEVTFRSGIKYTELAGSFTWRHKNELYDIIAYRIQNSQRCYS